MTTDSAAFGRHDLTDDGVYQHTSVLLVKANNSMSLNTYISSFDEYSDVTVAFYLEFCSRTIQARACHPIDMAI
jgi:hypothetical protein